LLVDRPISTPLFLAAILVSSWLGGIRVGIFASIISGLVIDYYYFQPFSAFGFGREEIIRLILFQAEGSLMCWLIEKVRTASEEIRYSREELRDLTQHLQSLRETEQKRIALEIHDDLGQSLTRLKMDVHVLNRRLGTLDRKEAFDEVPDTLSSFSGRIDDAIDSVRRIASDLRPLMLDDLGLVAACEWQASEFARTTGITCDFRSDIAELDMGPDSNTAIFRIFQEALTNIARHSGAKKASINFTGANTSIVITIADNGRGIRSHGKKNTQGLGHVGMRERTRVLGGQLTISNGPLGGTVVELYIPRVVAD